MKSSPVVSVLVHTKNSERTIRNHLESILNQTYKQLEIIMVDNHSSDKTVDTARTLTNGKIFSKRNIYLHGPERSAQRNFGAKKARGDYYLVPDSDMVLTKDVVKECVESVLRDKATKAVIIPEKSVGRSFWAQCKALERNCYVGDDTIEAARFFEKSAFWMAGGYDESLTGPEDWDLPQRIAKTNKIGRIKSFIIHDEGQVTLGLLAKKKYYYGLKASKYIKKHPISSTAQQVVYLLRPAFYKNWKKLFKQPMLTFGMLFMLGVEQFAGFLGFVRGSMKR